MMPPHSTRSSYHHVVYTMCEHLSRADRAHQRRTPLISNKGSIILCCQASLYRKHRRIQKHSAQNMYRVHSLNNIYNTTMVLINNNESESQSQSLAQHHRSGKSPRHHPIIIISAIAHATRIISSPARRRRRWIFRAYIVRALVMLPTRHEAS